MVRQRRDMKLWVLGTNAISFTQKPNNSLHSISKFNNECRTIIIKKVFSIFIISFS